MRAVERAVWWLHAVQGDLSRAMAAALAAQPAAELVESQIPVGDLDGDTCDVRIEGRTVRLRLDAIDCLEDGH